LDIFDLDFAHTNNASLKVSQTSSLLFMLVVLYLGFVVLTKTYPELANTIKTNVTSVNKDFSILFFLGFLSLFTGFVVFF
jgi:hypothetical protein